MKLKKSEIREKLNTLFIRRGIETNSNCKSMVKKELKEFINVNGGFTKTKINAGRVPTEAEKYKIPEGAFGFEAVLSNESVNMNGYRILLSAREEGFKKYFEDFEGLVYLQHDMDKPIGKTLEIFINEEQKTLNARGFAYDDLTQNIVSRGLLHDISTGHLALEIKYINKETNEEKTPDEFEEMMWEMVERMFDGGKSWSEIQQTVADMRQLRIETHTKVQIVEYSLVSVGANTQAEIKKINNTAEIFKNNGLEDVELEQDEERKEEKKEEEEKENPETSEENLRKEGETPEASSNDTALTSENEEEAATPSTENEEGEAPATGGDVEPNAIKLKAQLLEVQAKLKVAEEYNERLEKEKAELETQLNYHNSKVIVKKTDLKENMVTPTEEDIAKVKSNLSRIYQRP